MTTAHDFQVTSLTGQPVDLKSYADKVMLIVNTASKCGFTPQYQGLEELYQKYSDKLVVLGFPCNQFGKQEPGDSEEIGEFCQVNYGVSFPMFEKVDVNGDNEEPLYTYLKSNAPGLMGSKNIKWNFTKFLVGQKGKVLRRYAPTTKPQDLIDDVEALL
jgi:glutathione peroxidase